MQHPTSESLPVLLKALPSSDATTRDKIIEILAVYNDVRKIPALITYNSSPGWGEKSESVDSQLVALGAPAVDALIKSLPDDCSPGGRNSDYAYWVGSVLGEVEPEGTRAMLAGLMTQQPCMHEASRSGLLVARRNGMSPVTTTDEEEKNDEMDAGVFLLVNAAEDHNPTIHTTAINWIRSSLQRSGWSNGEYAEFLEALIQTYRSNVVPETRVEIARMLATTPCRRVDRFMRAAVHSPLAEVRTIALKYLAPKRPASTP